MNSTALSNNVEPGNIVDEPHSHDILTGENGTKVHANHGGNVYFLKLLVSDYNEWATKKRNGYNTKDGENANEASAKRILQKIRSRNPSGRFLKEAEETNGNEDDLSLSSKSCSKRQRWQLMTHSESLTISMIYFGRVKSELEKKRRKKSASSNGAASNSGSSSNMESKNATSGSKKRALHQTNHESTKVMKTSSEEGGRGSDCAGNGTSLKAMNAYDDNHDGGYSNTASFVEKTSKFTRGGVAGIEIHEHDVLKVHKGESDNTKQHAGNLYLKTVIQKHAATFLNASSHQEREVMVKYFAQVIIGDIVNIRNPPGRFLEYDAVEKQWVEMEQKEVYAEVERQLRVRAKKLAMVAREKKREISADEVANKSDRTSQNNFNSSTNMQVSQSPTGPLSPLTKNRHPFRKDQQKEEKLLIKKPHRHDMLFGKAPPKVHLANDIFHGIAARHKAQFQNIESQSVPIEFKQESRKQIAKLILNEFESCFDNPRSRFLRFDKQGNGWYGIGHEKALIYVIELLMTSFQTTQNGQNQNQERQPPRQILHTGSTESVDDSQRSQRSQRSINGTQSEQQESSSAIPFIGSPNDSQRSQQSQRFMDLTQMQQYHEFGQQRQSDVAKGKISTSEDSSLNFAAEKLRDKLQNGKPQPSKLISKRHATIPTFVPDPTPISQVDDSSNGSGRREDLVISPTPIRNDLSQYNDSTQEQQQNDSLLGLPGQMTSVASTTNISRGPSIVAETNRSTISEWMNLMSLVDEQVTQLRWQNFQAKQLQERYATRESNSQQQLQLLNNYRMQLTHFRQQLQQQQNADQYQAVLQQLQSQFQSQLQELQAKQQQEQYQQQMVQQRKLDELQKQQETEKQKQQQQLKMQQEEIHKIQIQYQQKQEMEKQMQEQMQKQIMQKQMQQQMQIQQRMQLQELQKQIQKQIQKQMQQQLQQQMQMRHMQMQHMKITQQQQIKQQMQEMQQKKFKQLQKQQQFKKQQQPIQQQQLLQNANQTLQQQRQLGHQRTQEGKERLKEPLDLDSQQFSRNKLHRREQHQQEKASVKPQESNGMKLQQKNKASTNGAQKSKASGTSNMMTKPSESTASKKMNLKKVTKRVTMPSSDVIDMLDDDTFNIPFLVSSSSGHQSKKDEETRTQQSKTNAYDSDSSDGSLVF